MLVVENLLDNAGRCTRHRFAPWFGRIPGGGRGNPLQYCCLENPMDRGDRQAAVHRVLQSRIQPKWLSTHAPGTNWTGYSQTHIWLGEQGSTLGTKQAYFLEHTPGFLFSYFNSLTPSPFLLLTFQRDMSDRKVSLGNHIIISPKTS